MVDRLYQGLLHFFFFWGGGGEGYLKNEKIHSKKNMMLWNSYGYIVCVHFSFVHL